MNASAADRELERQIMREMNIASSLSPSPVKGLQQMNQSKEEFRTLKKYLASNDENLHPVDELDPKKASQHSLHI